MHFHSPSRPRLAGLVDSPQYLGAKGQPIAVLPTLHLRPTPDGSWKFEAMLMCGPNRATYYQGRAQDLAEAQDWLRQYQADPEAWLAKALHYGGPQVEPVQGVSLASLGLGQPLQAEPQTITLASLGLGESSNG